MMVRVRIVRMILAVIDHHCGRQGAREAVSDHLDAILVDYLADFSQSLSSRLLKSGSRLAEFCLLMFWVRTILLVSSYWSQRWARQQQTH